MSGIVARAPRPLHRRALVLAGLGAVAAPRPGWAATIEVAPVLTELPVGQMAAVITLTNRGAAEATMQVRAFDWSQPGGDDRLLPTEDLVVSPPLFGVAPGAAQTVRLLLRRPANGAERAFRLLADEIPGAASGAREVRIAIRLSLPVFAQPAAYAGGEPRPVLDWSLRGGQLAVRNRGGRRARLAGLALVGPGGAPLALSAPENPYVLPGAERRWTLRGAAPRPGTVLRARATGEAGAGDVEITAAAG